MRVVGMILSLNASALANGADERASTSPTPDTFAGAAASLGERSETAKGQGDSMQLERARSLFWRAYHEYSNRRYDRAAELFESSYETYPQAEVLFNIALASAKDGQCNAARARAADYAAKLSLDNDDPQTKFRLEQIERECASDAAVESALKDNSATIESDHDGVPGATATASATATKEPAVVRVLAPSPSNPSPMTEQAVPSSYWSSQRKLGWGLVGGALLSGGLTAYIAGDLVRNADAREQLMAEVRRGEEDSNTGDRLQRLEQERTKSAWLTGIAAAATVGFSVVGVVLLTDRPSTIKAQVGLSGYGSVECGVSGQF